MNARIASAPPRRVVLGVTGSIAAYKAAELVRLLRKAKVDVHVVLTESGARFITPITLGTLSGNPVSTEMFADTTGGPYVHWGGAGGDEGGIEHIRLSRDSSLIVVAPATANILGKVAHGIADDVLSAAILASSTRVLFAPAMNTRMWESAAVQDNLKLLRKRGFLFVEPGSGDLACGEVGAGRMAEPEAIAGDVLRLLAVGPGVGRRLLVTAGRTEEPLDPVRVLSNRSSGKMGFAVAAAGRDLGYGVTLIAGVTSESPPPGVDLVRVATAEEMGSEVQRRHAEHEVLVMAAAVADYRVRRPAKRKISGGQDRLSLDLVPTTDILASIRGRRRGKVTIGFALETGRGTARAREKLAAKGCDMMVVNNPLLPGSEFGGDTNEVTFLYPDGRVETLPRMDKYGIGLELLNRAEAIQAAQAPVRRPRGRTA